MNNGTLIEIVILAMIALFLVWKLGSVLGRRTGHERHPDSMIGADKHERRANGASDGDKVVPLPGRQGAETAADIPPPKVEPGVSQGVTQIRIADPSFDPASFAKGAGTAFGMVVTAFAEGDTLENTIEAIKSTEIVDARMEGRTAFVTVKFVSSQINVTRNADGEVTDGDPETAVDVTDLWTFARNTRATDPNWTLVETDTPT